MNLSRAIAQSVSSQLKTRRSFICSSHFTTSAAPLSLSRPTDDILAKELIQRPSQWVDHRKDKLNGLVKPSYPDFKHKYDGHALWIDRLPDWALSKLDDLEFPPRKEILYNSGESVESFWKELLEMPNEWTDYRKTKVNPNYPDFKHKDSGKGLWVNQAPSWVKLKLDALELGSLKSIDSFWSELVEKPNEWIDYRKKKLDGSVNPKFPDFKHKDGRQALWLGDAPEYVLSKVDDLDFCQSEDVGSTKSLWNELVEKPDEWIDNRKKKLERSVGSKFPDFRHKDSRQVLWLKDAPEYVLSKVDELDFRQCDDGGIMGSLWNELLEKPNEWIDYRKKKLDGSVSPIFPDYRHKDSRQVLWLCDAPEYVLSKIDDLDFRQCDDGGIMGSIWNKLVEKPNEWIDYRKKKLEGLVSPKYPDFKHKGSKQVLWLSGAPESVLSKVDELDFCQGKDGRSTESLWKELFDKPNEWLDNRIKTGNPKYPDFTHKDSGKGLWLDKAPDWILEKIDLLEFLQPEGNKVKSKEFVEALWKDLVEKPTEWFDYRKMKLEGAVNSKYPDFKQKCSGQSLWFGAESQWVLSKLKGLDFDQPKGAAENQKSMEDYWIDYFENPNLWRDRRNDKLTGLASPQSPDFRHSQSSQALWVSTAPKWAVSKLEFLEKSCSVKAERVELF